MTKPEFDEEELDIKLIETIEKLKNDLSTCNSGFPQVFHII